MSEPARWSQEDLDAYMRSFPGRVVKKSDPPTESKIGKRSQPQKGVMNKTEMQYAAILAARLKIGEIAGYHFESKTFVLEPRNGKIAAVRYTPDFSVTMPSGVIQMIEIKAGRKRKSGNVRPHFEDGARERLLRAAQKFAEYEWYLAWLWKGHWEVERIK